MTVTTRDVSKRNTALLRGAVITPDHVHYGDGRYAYLGETGLHHDIGSILHGVTGRFDRHSTIVIDGAFPQHHVPGLETIRGAGWKCSKMDAWTTYYRDDGTTVSVGLRDAMTPGVHFGILFNADTDPGVVAMQLDRYHQHTGTSWRGTAATSALAALRMSWENAAEEPLWKNVKNGPGVHVGALIWERELNEWERTWGYVHTFDTNQAYLSAAINAEVAWSSLERTGPQLFDPSLPGYWLLQLDTVTLEKLADPTRPPLLDARTVMRGGEVWVTTPYARLLAELGDRCEVVDAWTGRRTEARELAGGKVIPGHSPSARVFRTWGERIRDGVIAATGTPTLTAVKATYKDLPGAMQRESMRIVRPDWAHTIIDLARATLYRRILRVHQLEGVWPVRVATDSVSYADSTERRMDHWRASLGIRPGLGGFKHEATATTDEWLASHKPRPPRKPRAPRRPR